MTEIIIAGPYCTPLRNQILTGLRTFGVTSARITDAYVLFPDGTPAPEGSTGTGKNGDWPTRQIYHIRVRAKAAAWAEYLLLRTGKYELLSRPLESRNERWAAKWGGAMPQPWAVGDCASKVTAAKPGAKPVQLKDDSIGARLLRQLRRGGAR